MDLPYQVTGYLGHGGNASVFRAMYEGHEAALKVGYGPRERMETRQRQSMLEFSALNRLEDVKGIPNPVLSLPHLNGTYHELGLDSSGKPMEEVVDQANLLGNEPYFSGAVLMDLINGKVIFRRNEGFNGNMQKQPEEFFDDLDRIVEKVHSRELSLPFDFTMILGEDKKPHIIDWILAEDFTRDYYTLHRPEAKKEKIEEDIKLIRDLRARYQINGSRSLASRIMPFNKSL